MKTREQITDSVTIILRRMENVKWHAQMRKGDYRFEYLALESMLQLLLHDYDMVIGGGLGFKDDQPV